MSLLIDQLETIMLGNQGEAGVTEVAFDVTEWQTLYPTGAAAVSASPGVSDGLYLTYTLPGDATVYTELPTNLDLTAEILTWTPPAAVLASDGDGTAVVHCLESAVHKCSPLIVTKVSAGHAVEGIVLPQARVLTTAGDMLTFTTEPVRLPIGTNDYVLRSNGSAPVWSPDKIDTHIHGNITNAGKIGSVADLPVFTGAAGLVEAKTASAAVALLKSAIVDTLYPIGSIYMSVVSANPGTLFGGTWEVWGAGRVPVGIDATDVDFDTVEETGGSKTQSHGLTAGYAKLIASTVSTGILMTEKGSVSYTATRKGVGASNGAEDTSALTSGTELGGTTDSAANLPPYVVCYMFKRTA